MTPILGQSDLVTLIIYAVVGIIAAARITRLVVADDYPLSIRLRIWWDKKVKGPWNKLLHCPWCFGPWATLLVGALAYGADQIDLAWLWFVIFGWLAASYATSWLVFHDED